MLFQIPYYGGSYGTGSFGGQVQGVFSLLEQWGLVDAFLPFLVIFLLLNATLNKINIFTTKTKSGNDPEKINPDRKVNGIISFAISAMIIIPHALGRYPPQYDPVVLMTQFIPGGVVLLLAVMLVLMLLGLTGTETSGTTGKVSKGVGYLAAGLLGIVILRTIYPSFAPDWLLGDSVMQALIVILLVMGLIVAYALGTFD